MRPRKGSCLCHMALVYTRLKSPSTPDEKRRMDKISYASAIGSIMYAMVCTHPDISYALSAMSRYLANPGERHWTVVKNIRKYLKRTKDMSG